MYIWAYTPQSFKMYVNTANHEIMNFRWLKVPCDMSGAYLMVQESQDPLGPIDGWWKKSCIHGRYWYLLKDDESGFRNSLWVNMNSVHKPIMCFDVFRGIWKLRRVHLGMANCWEALKFRDRDTFEPSSGQWSKMSWYKVEIEVAWSMKMGCFCLQNVQTYLWAYWVLFPMFVMRCSRSL